MIFDHFNIDVPAELLLDTKAFYENIFNLKEGFRPQLSRTGFWMYFEDKPILHLFKREECLPKDSKSYLDHVAFKLVDIEAFKIRLDKFNVPYRSLINKEINIIQLFILDPANVKIECIFDLKTK